MQRRKPRKITPDYLERAALFYLERYSSSETNLQRVLERKARRAAQESELTPEPDQVKSWIAAVLDKLVRNGLLDDRRFAESRVRRLYSEGKSLGRIRQALAAKGVGTDHIEAAVRSLVEETPGAASDLPAAAAYAKRRRLGPYRTDPAERREMRQKDLGALARRGFSQTVAMTILGAADIDALQELLNENTA